MLVSGQVLPRSATRDRSGEPVAPAANAASATALAEGVEGIAELLSILRKQLAALSVPDSESAAELSQGLDIAWIGARRLQAELAASSGSRDALSRGRQSPRPKSPEQQRVV